VFSGLRQDEEKEFGKTKPIRQEGIAGQVLWRPLAGYLKDQMTK